MAQWKSQQEDEFFGDLEETPINSHKNGIGPPLRAPSGSKEDHQQCSSPPPKGDNDDHDELMLRDKMARSEQFRNMGYLEAYDESKEIRLQEGFEEGYRQFFEASMNAGEILGALAAKENIISREVGAVDRSGTSDALTVARRIRTLLNRLDGSVEDQDIQTELLGLVEERTAKNPATSTRSINDIVKG